MNPTRDNFSRRVLECDVYSIVSIFACAGTARAGEQPLWRIPKMLAAKKHVDLTHEFAPGIPRWPGFPDETRKTLYWYEKRPDTTGSGFFSELFTHVGQWGTQSILLRTS